jgi:glycosyltransferase involved in cell wall biosynthesis
MISVLRNRPFLLEIRDLWPAFAIDMGVLTHPVLIYLSKGLERFLYRVAGHILVNSPAYRDYLINKGISAKKISLIPNGVDTRMFEAGEKPRAVRRRWNLDGQFVVTYAGALGMANDIETLLRAAKKLKEHEEVHFLIVGDGKERKNLEAAAREWDLGNVTFTGSRPKSEMPGILAASDACVAILRDIPMFRTTYPNKVFDYMAAGRPTILAIDGVIRDVVEKADGGVFVGPGNAAALAEAVLALARDRDRAGSMGRAARAYVVEHFDRERQAEAFVGLLKRMVD